MIRYLALAGIAVATVGCQLLNPEAGMEVPRDPGTVSARVADQAGVPIAGVRVAVHTETNGGSPYSVASYTKTDGTVLIRGIRSGLRRVEITLPAGFTAGTGGLFKEVDVVKDRTVHVEFVLVRP